MSAAVPEGRRTRGGAEARRAQRTRLQITQLPYIRRKIPLTEILNEEGLQLIERNADTILEEIGIEFRDDEEALQLWKEAGADVKGTRVRFPRGSAALAHQKTAPATSLNMRAIPSARSRSAAMHGLRAGLRPALHPQSRRGPPLRDDRGFPQLREARLHDAGDPPLRRHGLRAGRLARNKRHLDMVYSHIRYSDKPFMGSVTHPERAAGHGRRWRSSFRRRVRRQNCVIISLINANSPMVLDGTMLGALKVYARANQATIVTPFILAGAMSPVTVAGTLAQVLAEVLAGAGLTQLVRPGAPVIFGIFASSISMQSGAPTFGTPEPTLVLFAAGAACAAARPSVPHRRLALRLEDPRRASCL